MFHSIAAATRRSGMATAYNDHETDEKEKGH